VPKLYGIASRHSDDVGEWRPTREEAESVLAQILKDEPGLAGVLYIAVIELAAASDN
jgi:hypothetical protein